MRHDWHASLIAQVSTDLQSDVVMGLATAEAVRRRAEYGLNQLATSARSSPVWLLFHQLNSGFIWILLASIILSGLLGHTSEAIAIGIIIGFSVLLGFFQEWRAERALEALQEFAVPHALVLRDGVEQDVSTAELVPGDIVLFEAGTRIPADVRLLESVNLLIEEAVLTGESMAVEKEASMVYPIDTVLTERKNMAFMGTMVTNGRGRGMVVAIGMDTEFGHIAGLLQRVERLQTPFQKNLSRLATILTRVVVLIVLGIVLIGIMRHQPFLELLVFATALAVAAVPEALPAVVTMSLAIGVQRMAKHHVLVRYLPVVETLGCTTYICSDKTGTLTKNEMTVRKMLLPSGIALDVMGSGYDPQGAFLWNDQPYAIDEQLQRVLQAAVLSSDAHIVLTDGVRVLRGDPTEGALIVAAEKAGISQEILNEHFPRIAEIPFSSESKRMTTLHTTPEGTIAYGKGAAEIILASCTHIHSEKGIELLSDTMRGRILETVHTFAEQALRVIGVAYAMAHNAASAERDMIFLGLFGMIDPPRPEAKQAILRCREAGIKVLMMTGDHAQTAKAISRELALLGPESRVVTGQELSRMSSEQLEREIETISVCARVSPEHKLRIVEVLQQRGHIVAMTGDGVNDAPALKKADIGIAMGITGTDVTREAATMTLTDDNFASIVAAVEEGRVIFANVKKCAMYLLSSNFGEIGLIAMTVMCGLPVPLSAVQILYLNLASDGLPALALALDPKEHDSMQHPPRHRRAGLFSSSAWIRMGIGGAWVAVAQLSLYVWARRSGMPETVTTTMVFTSLVLMQLMSTYCFRSERRFVLSRLLSNSWLNRAVVWEVSLLLFILYFPLLQKPLGTVGLAWHEWLIVLGVATTIVPILEITKYISTHYTNNK